MKHHRISHKLSLHDDLPKLRYGETQIFFPLYHSNFFYVHFTLSSVLHVKWRVHCVIKMKMWEMFAAIQLRIFCVCIYHLSTQGINIGNTVVLFAA
jgi:hypothetical protein